VYGEREIIFAGDGEMNTEKLFGKKNLIIAAAIAAGIALIIAGGVLSSKENSGGDDGKSAIAGKLEYELQLERRIEELCLSLDGINSAKALVTLDGGTEEIYASNSRAKTDDRSGENSVEYPSSSDALRLGEKYPEIRGVAVVVSGGESAQVRKNVTELLSSSLGISSNRIAVGGGK
jgi:archaellin